MTDANQYATLKDGTTVLVRPLEADDGRDVEAFLSTLPPAAVPDAFHKRIVRDGGRVLVDRTQPPRHLALVATIAEGAGAGRIVAAAQCDRDSIDPATASFSVLVVPELQDRGLATTLVRALAEAAHAAGVRALEGEVGRENKAMLAVLEDVGLRVERATRADVVHASVDLEPTDAYLAEVARGEKASASAALTRFFRPDRIAVVGASRTPEAIGGLVFANILAGGFRGVVYPVNPATDAVQGVAAYASLRDCPAVPDLVMVCVPAALVADVIDEVIELGVRAACVISAGFAETGDAGRRAQRALVGKARAAGLRLVGPNCMGLLNGVADVRLNATFSRIVPRPGRLSFVSQSGALGLSVLAHLDELGLGVSGFVSVGNKADISGNDLLLYWEDDPETDVILLYLESFGNPRRFSRIARRISKSKPIIAVKAGRTTAGRRAASSHTAALAAGDRVVDALFRQTGVIRTDTLEEMFAVATVATTQPPPAGRRVAIMTNGGGPGILAADACESLGLTVVELGEGTQNELRRRLPEGAGVTNPVDMIASSTAEHYAATLRVLGTAAEVDAVIAIFIPPIVTRAEDVARALAAARHDLPPNMPVLAVFMDREGMTPTLAEARIPSFAFPENAARALSALAGWAEWSRRPSGHIVQPDGVDVRRARAIVDRSLEGAAAGEDRWLAADDAAELLEAFGIPLARHLVVSTPAEASDAVEALGATEVAVKIATAIHKKDVGGVSLGLRTPAEAAAAVETMRDRLESAGLGEHAGRFLVQEMIGDGVEMVVGVTQDPSFGPLVVVGCGGSLVELIDDVSLRITPLTDIDVDEMLTSLRTYPLLTGFRGGPALDVNAVKDLLYRVNYLVETVPELAEMDLNPVFARRQGVVAADLRIALTPASRW